jgi:dolichol-phosphate mannosyltransferase
MVSIVLPTYNEKENITALVSSILLNVPQPAEVVVVDDDSPDLTWKIAEDMGDRRVRVIRRKGERGLATAIERGIRESKGDVVGWMDADMCMPPSLIPEMLKYIGEYDLVIGSRYAPGGADKRGFFRVFTSRVINTFAQWVLGGDIKDHDSGFMLMKKSVFDRTPFPPAGYGDYFIELVYKAKRAGFRIKEVPYIFRDRAQGTSKTAGNILTFLKLGSGYIFRIIKLRSSGK